jgi:thiol-disulfide isomerase/thioredoxin
MKKILLSALVIATSLSLNAQLALSVGSTAPDWTVTDVHGQTHNLYDITAAGQPVIIDFFFTTCGPCQATAPIITRFYQKYGCNQGDIFVISIDSGDTDAEVLAYEATYAGPNTNPSASGIEGGGNAVISAYGPSAYPTVCLIGTDNILKSIDIWPINSIADIENAVAAAGITINEMDCLLGIEEPNENNFTVYPNPSSGDLFVELSNATNENTKITIYDMSGKLVFQQEASNLSASEKIQISLNGIENGMYTVNVQNGEKFSTRNFVLNR